MVTGHFGLDDGPFHGKAEGEDVYVGPQQATVISRLRKALGTGDTAVAVSGPVGVGKTTLVRRALADIAGRKIVISVDRIRLEPDEVLDLLLSRFEVSRPPKGTIQRVAAFRRLLQERLSDDVRVFIVVEDAERVGVDALLELEALTATDSDEPVGANIVLMGDSDMPSLLAKPALARLRQRIRLRQAVAPFDAAEVEGYMRHCLEAAGGVLEQIFEPGTTRVVHRYSGGVARVVDNLCESALVAAAEAGLATILPEFLQEVAENCGLEPQGPDAEEVAADPAETDPPAVEETVDEAADETVDETIDAAADETVDEAIDAAVDETVDEAIDPAADEAVDEAFDPAADRATIDESFADEDPEPADAPFAPPKLALVAKPPLPAGDAAAEDPPQLELPELSDEPEPEARVSPPPVDLVAAEETGAAPVAPSAEEQWKARSASLTVSRIDEVLPELLERLQSSARGRSQPSAFLPAEPQPDDDHDLPTLSNSMRVAVLPVRRMEERPLTAEDVRDDESSEATAEPAADEESSPESPAAEAGEPAHDDETGIAEALSETDVEPPAEDDQSQEAIAAEAFHEPEPVAAAADEVREDAEPPRAVAGDALDDPAPVDANVRQADEPGLVDVIAEESPEDAVPPEIPAGLAAPDELESPMAELADEEQPAAESPSLELASLADDSFSLGTVVAEGSDEDETTEAATLADDDGELALAPDAATDVFVAENDDGDAEPELDALQAAIQAASAWEASDATGATDDAGTAGEPATAPAGEARADLPEITLDAELEKRKPSPTEQLDQWAEELSKAKSLEDISDILAETIFGNEEIEAISAEIRAKKAAEKAAAEPAAAPQPTPAPSRPGAAASRPNPPAARPAPTRPASPAPKAPPAAPARPAAGGINMTMSQRIQMVNSLKGGASKPLRPLAGMPVAEIVLAEHPDEPLAKAAKNAPAPIEAQIDTAITQSRKALSEADLARMASADKDADDDDDGDRKGSRGLFGFFRRSSKS